MFKVFVIEDEDGMAETLKRYIDDYQREKDIKIAFERYSNAEEFLSSFSGGVNDVVFMDIELPGMDGMTAAKKLREKFPDVLLLFVTNLAQYAINGYEVKAFDFVVKPFSYPQFVMKMDRICEYFDTIRQKEILVSSRQGKKVLPVSEILYVEVNKHVITYHMKNQLIVSSGTLKEVSENLDDKSFSLCNQCYLVNLRYVDGLKGNTLYIGKEELQISSPKRKEFLRDLTRYLGMGGNN